MGRWLAVFGSCWVWVLGSSLFSLVCVVVVIAGTFTTYLNVFVAYVNGLGQGGTPTPTPTVPTTIHGPPTTGFITATFHDPGYSLRFGRRHEGLDIGNALNTPVYNTVDKGVVELIAWDTGGYGLYIIIRDPASGWATLYAHLQSVLVSENERPCWGCAIGQMGSTGNSTGPHLHYEIRKPDNRTRVDPLQSRNCC